MLPGNYGNTIDGQIIKDPVEGDQEPQDDRFVHSLTPQCKAISTDRQYYHVPYDDTKPCLHIKFNWQDHRRRLYLSNMLYKILETLVGGWFGVGSYKKIYERDGFIALQISFSGVT